MQLEALELGNDVPVVLPTGPDIAACRQALRSMPERIDWSGCEVGGAGLDVIKIISKELSASCAALRSLVQKLGDPQVGFAIWDSRGICGTDDKDLQRRLIILLGTAIGHPFGAFKKHGFWKPIGVNTEI